MATNSSLSVQGMLKKLQHTALQVYSTQIFFKETYYTLAQGHDAGTIGQRGMWVD